MTFSASNKSYSLSNINFYLIISLYLKILSGNPPMENGFNLSSIDLSVADPGFPRGGGTNSPRGGGGGAPTYHFAKFSQKLHEIERIWARGGARPSRPPLDPPVLISHI